MNVDSVIVTLHIQPIRHSGGSAQSIDEEQQVVVNQSNITSLDVGTGTLIISGYNVFSGTSVKRSLFDNDTKTRNVSVVIRVGLGEIFNVYYEWDSMTNGHIFTSTEGSALISGSCNYNRHEVDILVDGLTQPTSYSFSLMYFPE